MEGVCVQYLFKLVVTFTYLFCFLYFLQEMSLSICAFVPYARTRFSLSVYHTHAIKIIHSLILYINLAMAKSEAPVNKFIILNK